MNFAQIMGLLRLILGMGGAAALTANGFDGNAISSILAHVTTPQGLIELVPIVAAGAWSLYTHSPLATAQRAVQMSPGTTAAQLAAHAPETLLDVASYTPAPAAKMKPTGLSRMVDK